MTFRDPMVAEQQVVEVIFKVRPGAVCKGLEVLRILIKRRELVQLQIKLVRSHNPPGFLHHRLVR